MRGASSDNIGGLSNPLTRTLVLIKSPVRVCRTVTGRNKKVQSLLVMVRPNVSVGCIRTETGCRCQEPRKWDPKIQFNYVRPMQVSAAATRTQLTLRNLSNTV